MTLPIIGNAKELDPQVIADHEIVAAFGYCQTTLCITDHSLDRFKTRGCESPTMEALEKLYYLLATSLVIKRDNAKAQALKYGKEAVTRFEDGWLFTITWIQEFGFWLLETVYPKRGKDRLYEIKYTREAIRASAWVPGPA